MTAQTKRGHSTTTGTSETPDQGDEACSSVFLSTPGDEEPQTSRFLPFTRRRRTETSVRNKNKKETGQKEAFFSLFRGAGKPLKHLEPALGRIEKREEKKKGDKIWVEVEFLG